MSCRPCLPVSDCVAQPCRQDARISLIHPLTHGAAPHQAGRAHPVAKPKAEPQERLARQACRQPHAARRRARCAPCAPSIARKTTRRRRRPVASRNGLIEHHRHQAGSPPRGRGRRNPGRPALGAPAAPAEHAASALRARARGGGDGGGAQAACEHGHRRRRCCWGRRDGSAGRRHRRRGDPVVPAASGADSAGGRLRLGPFAPGIARVALRRDVQPGCWHRHVPG
jgi:hypothetical protein